MLAGLHRRAFRSPIGRCPPFDGLRTPVDRRSVAFMPKSHRRRLKRADIVRALTRLGELCAAQGDKVELAIYGGTVMMFAYDCRAATKDIDAIFHPPEVVEPLIEQIARERNLPVDWINNGVKDFVGAKEARTTFAELQVPGLMITRPAAEYLLAMKCMAARLPTPFRSGDVADIKFLMKELAITSMKQIDAIVGDFYGGRALENGKRWLVAELLKEVSREKKSAK
jgi:hypothetical protein